MRVLPCSAWGRQDGSEKRAPSAARWMRLSDPLPCRPVRAMFIPSGRGALGERKDLILGHEAVGEVVEVGSLVRDFVPGDRVIVTAITPDWGARRRSAALRCTPAACLRAGSFPITRTACSRSFSMSTKPMPIWRSFRMIWTPARRACSAT